MLGFLQTLFGCILGVAVCIVSFLFFMDGFHSYHEEGSGMGFFGIVGSIFFFPMGIGFAKTLINRETFDMAANELKLIVTVVSVLFLVIFAISKNKRKK